MIIEKIRNKFKEINTPILLFFDAEQEYREEVLNIIDEDFKVFEVKENYFRIKYEVEILNVDSKILLYHPFERPTTKGLKDYPLTDLLFANEELLVDESGDIITKYAIHHSHAPLLMQYKRFVKANKYQSKLLPVLTANPFNPYKFQNAIISLLLNEKKVGRDNFNLIRIFEIINESAEQWEKQIKVLQKEKLVDIVIELIHKTTHIKVQDIKGASLQSLFLKLKYNALTRYIKEVNAQDPYKSIKISDEISLSKIELFFKEWEDDVHKSTSLDNVLQGLGSSVDETKVIAAYGTKVEFGLQTSHIIQYELDQVADIVNDKPAEALEIISGWQVDQKLVESFGVAIDFLKNTAKFYNLRKNYSDFDFNYIEDYIQKYESELYGLDNYYRQAYTAYQALDRELDAHTYQAVFMRLNKDYDQYLIDLNQSWLEILAEKNFDLNQAQVPKQYNFYTDFLATNAHKKVVIISDGFRYELAKDLALELKSDVQNAIDLKGMLASIPSYTNLGMSNLLPNSGIEAVIGTDSIDYSINGVKTNSSNREKILQMVEPDSLVLDYASFMRLSIADQREVLKPARLIYIYHNWMDNIGDKRSSEYYTFEAVAQCIDQLKLLIKKLYNSLNIYNVYVTADHGFLFNYNKIKENSRQVFPSVVTCLKEHTRFCLTNESTKSKDVFQLALSSTTNIQSDVAVILPKGINRFKKLGGFGVQFVHGGASIQELIVPVLSLSRKRNTKHEDVTFKRFDQLKTLATSSAKFKLIQEQVVGDSFQAITLSIGLYDLNNQLISNEVELSLNAVSVQPSDRIFEFKLELNATGSLVKSAYLKAYNKKDIDQLNPLLNDLIKINTLTEIDEFS